jgi:hypothetical protein
MKKLAVLGVVILAVSFFSYNTECRPGSILTGDGRVNSLRVLFEEHGLSLEDYSKTVQGGSSTNRSYTGAKLMEGFYNNAGPIHSSGLRPGPGSNEIEILLPDGRVAKIITADEFSDEVKREMAKSAANEQMFKDIKNRISKTAGWEDLDLIKEFMRLIAEPTTELPGKEDALYKIIKEVAQGYEEAMTVEDVISKLRDDSRVQSIARFLYRALEYGCSLGIMNSIK